MTMSTANERFWPATFADRGATVPFTTPVLAAARLRSRLEEKPEYLVPGLSGSKGTYVLPAKAVPEMFRLTVHDRALLEELELSEATAPYHIRIASLRVAGTGLAGTEAAIAARATLSAAENQELVTRLFIVLRALEQLTKQQTKMTVNDLMTEDGKQRARAELTEAGSLMGIELQTLLDQLERWGALVAPLGMPGSVAIGPMRRTWLQLAELGRAVNDWATGDWVDESKPDATLVAAVAEETNRVALAPIADIDREVDRMEKALLAWGETEARMKAAMDKLGWFLDGWDHVLKIWDVAQKESLHRQREALIEMVRMLPLIPQTELKASQHQKWADMTVSMRRQVRVLEGWTTGDVDLELMLRLEKYKSTVI